MTGEKYQNFTNELTRTLSSDSRVLGLVALGSMAERGRVPDRWSDHDFFVITKPGEQQWFREHREWLPDAAELVLFFQETPHGCKAVWHNGHLAEFAVFDPDEIAVARVNDYRVLFDRADVEQRIGRIAAAAPLDEAYARSMFLSNLLVAAQRLRRGETLSGRALLLSAARHLAALANPPDNLDSFRRLETGHPQLAASLEEALAANDAAALLRVYEAQFGTDDPAVTAIRKEIGR